MKEGITGRESVQRGIVIDSNGQEGRMLIGTKSNGGSKLIQAMVHATADGVTAVREERILNGGVHIDTIGYQSARQTEDLTQRKIQSKRLSDLTDLGGELTETERMNLSDLKVSGDPAAALLEALLKDNQKPSFGLKDLDLATPINPVYPRTEMELTFTQVGPGNKNEVNAAVERTKAKNPDLLKVSHNLREEALATSKDISINDAKTALLVQDEVSRALQVLMIQKSRLRQQTAEQLPDVVILPPVQITEKKPQEAVA